MNASLTRWLQSALSPPSLTLPVPFQSCHLSKPALRNGNTTPLIFPTSKLLEIYQNSQSTLCQYLSIKVIKIPLPTKNRETYRPIVIAVPTPAIAVGVFALDPDVPGGDGLDRKRVGRFGGDCVAREGDDSLYCEFLGGIGRPQDQGKTLLAVLKILFATQHSSLRSHHIHLFSNQSSLFSSPPFSAHEPPENLTKKPQPSPSSASPPDPTDPQGPHPSVWCYHSRCLKGGTWMRLSRS